MSNLTATPENANIAVRLLGTEDIGALRKVAQRDSASIPSGRLLGAEADGVVVAAISLEDAAIIADPFLATAPAVELLRLRARQLSEPPPPRRRFRIPSLPRARGAIAGSPPGGGSHLLQL